LGVTNCLAGEANFLSGWRAKTLNPLNGKVILLAYSLQKEMTASTQISNLLCFGRLSFLIITCLFGLVMMTGWGVSFGV